MRVAYQRFGGLAPRLVNRAPKLELELSARDEAAVRKLLPADFFALRAPPGGPRGRDAFSHEITVQDGARSHTVTLGEAEVPDSLRPLLDWLQARAKPG
jgi:hypothetical protein